MRKFKDGSIRDDSDGKFDFFGFRHPLCEHSFGKYMHEHRKMKNGSLRDADNWWKGWSKKVSIQSMGRHYEDLTAILAGFRVFKHTVKKLETTYYLQQWEKPQKDWVEVFEEDTCNAIRFNAVAYNLQVLKEKRR